jgi:hypothetical protein
MEAWNIQENKARQEDLNFWCVSDTFPAIRPEFPNLLKFGYLISK